jgi:hypothetical protein
MRDFLIALFTPMSPPKNYSFAQRDFAQEYQEMKKEYNRKQQKQNVYRAGGAAKFDYPLSGSRN